MDVAEHGLKIAFSWWRSPYNMPWSTERSQAFESQT